MNTMNKKLNIKLFALNFLILIFLSTFNNVFSQKTGYLKISGKVKTGKDNIANATINLYENNNKINTAVSNSNGDFSFNLDFNKIYTLEVSSNNYVPKKVLIDTKVPEKDLIYKYSFTVDLFIKIDGVDYSALNKPVTKIVYNEEADAFDYDIPYTETMRKEIDKIISQIESNKKQAYNQIIAKADELFKNEQYEEAINYYEKAIDLDPYNDYPDKQIMRCEKLIAQKRNAETNYNKFIAQGDNLFNKQDYINAKTAYQNALNIKPAEQYPKQKLAEIDKLIADKAAKEKAEAEAKAKEEQYKAAIAKGDAALAKQNFDEAKTAYNQALSIKPNEQYPKQKLAEIDKLIADKAAKEKTEAEAKAKEEQYKAAIAKGDAALAKQNFDDAKTAYNQALSIKPNEQYPKQKLAEIDKLIADKAAKEKAEAEAKAKEEQYKAAIAKGDAALAKQNFDEAKTAYNQALSIKPNEQYPKQKLAEIDKLIAEKAAKEKTEAEAKAKEEQYKAAIAKGDAALAKQNFDEAKTAYNQALSIKPNEQYPKQKLAEIDKLIADKAAKEKTEAEAKAKEEQYKAAIAKGDAALEKMNLTEAKSAYQDALRIKPEESYPRNKIVEIDNMLTQKQKKEQELQEKEKAYKEAIQKADNFYINKDYPTAITYYQTALKYKPNETYPRQRISECQEQLKLKNEEEQRRIAEEKQRLIQEQQEKLKKLEEINFNDKAAVEKYLSELARTYPEGVTEENYEDKTKKVKRIIVNRQGVASEYRQIQHNWGGEYFFKNGQSISKHMFLIETQK